MGALDYKLGRARPLLRFARGLRGIDADPIPVAAADCHRGTSKNDDVHAPRVQRLLHNYALGIGPLLCVEYFPNHSYPIPSESRAWIEGPRHPA